MGHLTRLLLDKGWEFKQAENTDESVSSSFRPVAQFPTVAHIDLLHHGLIPDPYIDDNETKCLWVNEADWTYRTLEFPRIDSLSTTEHIALVFEGLDTVVDVFLNGIHILTSKNMHVQHRVDVTNLLNEPRDERSLELRFRNAPAYSREEQGRIGYKGTEAGIPFGGPERLFLRKAQYHWGWDWGPAVNTCGPWKPIYLELFEKRIGRMIVRQEVAADLASAKIIIRGTVEHSSPQQQVTVDLHDPRGSLVQKEITYVVDEAFETTIVVEDVQLWYPHLYGEQPLYNVTINLPDHDSKSQCIGLRRLRLLQHSLKQAKGTSFVFEINNIRIFAGGSCWIPGDFMLPRMTPQRYYDWLRLVKSGNQTMIRVWGGGIIESDDFYDYCDREGILVWQDFPFACGNYPASEDFLENVKREAEQALERVGYHTSLVLWAGNNEDYMLAERLGWELDMTDEQGPWDGTNFPARAIYERLLPRLVDELGGDVPYWRSSPYGGLFSNDTTVGDTHIWDVWHGKMSPFQNYKDYTSRFVSEFGFESCPSLPTLHRAITIPAERHAQSRLFDIHDKGPGHTRRYSMYMSENFRFRMNPLEDFVYCTQFLQAEAMNYAYNCWRREFRGPEQENCAGVLVWQLNDIWPGTSWALVDVDLQPKPAYYITKRALANVVVGMERTITKEPHYIVTGYPPDKHALDVWAVNGTLERVEATLKLRAFDVKTGTEVDLPPETKQQTLSLAPNQTTEITSISIPQADETVVVAYLDRFATSERLARWVSWPEPLKFLHCSPELVIDAHLSDCGDKIFISATAPAKGVMLSVPVTEQEPVAMFDDNFLDLVPGEVVEIGIHLLQGRKVEVRYLYDWEKKQEFRL